MKKKKLQQTNLSISVCTVFRVFSPLLMPFSVTLAFAFFYSPGSPISKLPFDLALVVTFTIVDTFLLVALCHHDFDPSGLTDFNTHGDLQTQPAQCKQRPVSLWRKHHNLQKHLHSRVSTTHQLRIRLCHKRFHFLQLGAIRQEFPHAHGLGPSNQPVSPHLYVANTHNNACTAPLVQRPRTPVKSIP